MQNQSLHAAHSGQHMKVWLILILNDIIKDYKDCGVTFECSTFVDEAKEKELKEAGFSDVVYAGEESGFNLPDSDLKGKKLVVTGKYADQPVTLTVESVVTFEDEQ